MLYLSMGNCVQTNKRLQFHLERRTNQEQSTVQDCIMFSFNKNSAIVLKSGTMRNRRQPDMCVDYFTLFCVHEQCW